jgi:3-vinyl bacteriochlorophyllide hydratase
VGAPTHTRWSTERSDHGSGERAPTAAGIPAAAREGLYTADERRRRDASRWTIVQGVLAPVQFLIFAVSVCLVVRYLATGRGLAAADASVVLKTVALYAIMVTGSLWEKDVFGRYLFADAFYWEDVVSMGVIALHTAYVVALFGGLLTPTQRLVVALAGYAAYAVNATQFVLKLRAARLQQAAVGRSAEAAA